MIVKPKILYVFVDESGQDVSSEIFTVVAVVTDRNPGELREVLIQKERITGVGARKWKKLPGPRRLHFLEEMVKWGIGYGEVFWGSYPKPLPFFLPILDVVEKAIKAKADGPYRARVYVDGIDQQKARELTNALRVKGISLRLVKGRRDESEPIIRLADRWAGCLRRAHQGQQPEAELVSLALRRKHSQDVSQYKNLS